VHHQRQPWCLHDLGELRQHRAERDAAGEAPRQVVDAGLVTIVPRDLLGYLLAQRAVLRLEVDEDADPVLRNRVGFHARHVEGVDVVAEQALHLGEPGRLDVPDARQIRLAVLRARRRRVQQNLSVLAARQSWRGVIHPLRLDGGRGQAQQHQGKESSSHRPTVVTRLAQVNR